LPHDKFKRILILRVDEIGLSLEVDDQFLFTLANKGKVFYPNEFGGFLIGHYNANFTHLRITDTILPTNFISSKFSFQRKIDGIKEKLNNFYSQEPQKIYIGEWHTHPDNSSIPSAKDITAMNIISSSPDSNLANPILLIIGYSKDRLEYGFYVFYNSKMYKYE
jgi:[CysO sulfur-carrier protein]-S-L-cysteine hydrolase